MRRTLLSCALLLAAGHAVAATAWVSNEKDNSLSLIDMQTLQVTDTLKVGQRPRGLLPKRLSSVHPKFQTPFFATWMVGLFFGVVAAFVPLNILTELINIGTLAAFSLVSIAVVIMRKKRPDLKRTFRVPFVPVIPALAVIFCVMLMTYLSWHTWVAFAIWIVLGLIVYFGYARKRSLLN